MSLSAIRLSDRRTDHSPNVKAASSPAGAKVTIRDQQNAIVRELTGPADAGINRLVWDLRTAPPAGVATGRGAPVLPGQYSVTLAAAGREMTKTVQVDIDTRLAVPDSERRARFTFLVTANRLQEEIQRASDALSNLERQLTTTQEQLKTRTGTPASTSAAVDRVAATAARLRTRMGRPPAADAEGGGGGGGRQGLRPRVSGLYGEIDGGPGVQQGTLTGPTPSQRERLDAAAEELKTALADLNRLLTTDITALNQELGRAGVSPIVRPPTLQ